jgi:hypothetical protein
MDQDVLVITLQRRYIYDSRVTNRAGNQSVTKVESLKDRSICIPLQSDVDWGVGWNDVFELAYDVIQATPRRCAWFMVGEAPAGEAGGMYRMLVRAVACELNIPVTRVEPEGD